MGPVLRSAARGVVGSMAMSGMRRVSQRRGLVPVPPPEAVLHHGLDVLERVPERYRQVVEELAHWLYGGLGGAAFGALPKPVRCSRLAAPALGLGALAGYEAEIVPALGLHEAPRNGVAERLALLADHLLYGAVVAAKV